MSKKLKSILIFAIILAVVFFAFNFISKKKPKTLPAQNSPLAIDNGGILPSAINTNTTASDEFSVLLSSIKRINIDTSLFNNKAYQLLRDFPVSLGSEVVGRTNPFAPVGTDSDGAPVSLVIQTVQPGKLTATSAEFGAQITLPDTVPTSVVFEYGTTDSFGSATAPIVVTKSSTTLFTITKLNPDTNYFVRAVAVRGSNSIVGNTLSFTTNKK
ncbi:MAG TPA: fibronectin type III domain-containing protein [Candidatus Paceibacterota bacterium]|nr:fibronectin type III domain-containing protein [Candidatus Paceibacterota bacterium]